MGRVRVIEDGRNGEFNGQDLGGGNVSIIWIELPPGHGPKPHRHAYEKIFVVVEGNVTYTADGETIHATAGNVIVVPAGVVHGFVNAGPGVLRQVDIHATDRILTEWIDDGATPD